MKALMRPFPKSGTFPKGTMPKKRLGSLRPALEGGGGKEIALGPGKVELSSNRTDGGLRGVRTDGNVVLRAWKLIKMMEACFRQP